MEHLDSYLLDNFIKNIMIRGVTANTCIYHIVDSAIELGYNVLIILDCILMKNMEFTICN